MGPARRIVRATLRRLGLEVRRAAAVDVESPSRTRKGAGRGPLVQTLVGPMFAALKEGMARDGQDLVAVWLTGGRPGYFIDIGAEDGIRKSNTWLLEHRFGWRGVCVDANPNPAVRAALRANRSVAVDTRAIHSVSGERLQFATVLTAGRGGQSGLVIHRGLGDGLLVEESSVETVTLGDLLDQYGAPARVDYLSLDIEGAELNALDGLAGLSRRFSFITCEHNFGPDSGRLREVLAGAGYRVVLGPFSRNEFWAVDESGPFAGRFGPDGLPVGLPSGTGPGGSVA